MHLAPISSNYFIILFWKITNFCSWLLACWCISRTDLLRLLCPLQHQRVGWGHCPGYLGVNFCSRLLACLLVYLTNGSAQTVVLSSVSKSSVGALSWPSGNEQLCFCFFFLFLPACLIACLPMYSRRDLLRPWCLLHYQRLLWRYSAMSSCCWLVLVGYLVGWLVSWLFGVPTKCK